MLRARSDERLVALLRAGHGDAFEAIYDRHHAQILAFCRHMLGSREDAEDAAQHTFVAAHRDLVDSSRKVDLRPWLYAIARNRCLSMLRARREASELDESVGGGTEGLAEVVQRRQDLRELVGDIGRLPDDQRAAIVLFELGDLSQAQIAGVLGREPAQVKALVFQARTTLMQYRDARAIDCHTIREELANARGPALLRGHLRRHLRTCSDCRAYAEATKRQRVELGLLLPVIPTAGLKAATLAAAGGAAGAAGGGGGLGVAALLGAKGLILKGLAVVLAVGAVGATVEVADQHHHGYSTPATPAARRPAATKASGAATAPAASSAARLIGKRTGAKYRSTTASGAKHGHSSHGTPADLPATSRKPVSTPVKGANRQSTGHGGKSQSSAHSHKPAAPPGRLKSSTSPGHLRVPKLKTVPPATTSAPVTPTDTSTLPLKARGKAAE